MLGADHAGELGELPLLLERREHEVFLELLVVLLHESPDQGRGPTNDAKGGRIVGSESPDRLLIDEQDPAEHAVLTHQVLRGGNALLMGALRFLRWAGRCGRYLGQGDQSGACAGDARQELPTWLRGACHGCAI